MGCDGSHQWCSKEDHVGERPEGPAGILWDYLDAIYGGTWTCDTKAPTDHDSCLSHCIEIGILDAQKRYWQAVKAEAVRAACVPSCATGGHTSHCGNLGEQA